MKTSNLLKAFLMLFLMGVFVSCSDDDDDDDNTPTKIEITQAQLNSATNELGEFTGGIFAHGGPDGTTPDQTIRKVYSSLTTIGDNIAPGTILTKHTYAKGDDGMPSNLYVSFVMVKREAGYDPENKDWEYIKIPNDASNDYETNPFGMLTASNVERGKLAGCIGCHMGSPDGDYTFIND